MGPRTGLALATACIVHFALRLRPSLATIVAVIATAALAGADRLPSGAPTADPVPSLLAEHLLVTFYGNPHSRAMGVLGQSSGEARASALRKQADAYARFTRKRVLPAYHLVAVVAQPSPGGGGKWRRRESTNVIEHLLLEARTHGFHLMLDVQPGRATIREELDALRPFLIQPEVHLAIDPEFDMEDGQVPGRALGHTPAADVNLAISFLSSLVRAKDLPPKVLIVHQFTLGMLPDKAQIIDAPGVDVVLNMDGFGSQSLKLSTYRAIMRQHPLEFAGIKLFYTIDTGLFAPADVMRLTPLPSVVIYQ